MTQDGTDHIQRGELAEPVRNLRFAQSIVGAIVRTEPLRRHGRRYSDEPDRRSACTPSIRSRRFRFTPATLF